MWKIVKFTLFTYGKMEEIRITLETLYDILRNEKKREDLQKLESTFFTDVIFYLREKKALIALKREDGELFAAGEKDKLESELKSIKRILKEIYEKREKKIIDIALNKSKTGSDIIDTSAMLPEEKEFYQLLLNTMDKFRKGILINLNKGELPTIFTEAKSLLEEKKEQIKLELENLNQLKIEDSAKNPIKESLAKEGLEGLAKGGLAKENLTNSISENKTKIRFIRPMPSFVWKDMKVYGAYDTGEEIEIFTEVAELIVRKGRAEKV